MPEIAENLAPRLSEDEQAIDPTVHLFKAGLRDDCGVAAARCEVLPRLGEAGLQHNIADFAGGEKDSHSAGSPDFLPFAEGDGERAPSRSPRVGEAWALG
jgi:hypothetical protein